MTTLTTKINIQQDPKKPVEKNILAQAILDIAGAAKKLTQSGLNTEAIIVLTSSRSGYSKGIVRDVVNSLNQLERDFCR